MLTAKFALIAWPVVAIVFYRVMSLPAAFCATIIGGYLLLPTQPAFDFPLLPALGKDSIPALSAMVLTAIALRRRGRVENSLAVLPGWLPRHPVFLGLVLVLVLSAFATALGNNDELVYGFRTLKGVSTYDAFSDALSAGMLILPFLIARRVLATAENHRVLLNLLVVAAVGYAFLALYEIRMSPQLNNMVYGFFPHNWLQHVRAGGWRPLVFLNHGLLLGIFLGCAVLAAFGSWRHDRSNRRPLFLGAALWILFALLLSKTATATTITVVLLPVVLLLPLRLQMFVAAGVAIIVLSYPTLRYADVVPTKSILEIAEKLDPQRAASLEFRFDQEDQLLAKARERPLLGWGGWGRARVYDENGNDLSITDGFWVIVFGTGGWAAYIGQLGLMTAAVLLLAFRPPRAGPDPFTVVLCLVLTANLIDLIPNTGMSPVTFLMAGALAGRVELGRGFSEESARAVTAASRPQIRATLAYSRANARGDRKAEQPQRSDAAASRTEGKNEHTSELRFSRFAPTVERKR